VDHRHPANRDDEVLPDPVAARLLDRASQLDAALRTGAPVAELRAAAAEAGISAAAFDAALAELRAAEEQRTRQATERPRRSRARPLAAVLLGLAAFASMAVFRRATPVDNAAAAAVPVVEQAFLLRCLSSGEAAELMRPLLQLPTNTIVHSPARAPRVLTVRGTAEQMASVKALLDKHESAGSAACASPSAPAVTR
jgi:hypothetical protein